MAYEYLIAVRDQDEAERHKCAAYRRPDPDAARAEAKRYREALRAIAQTETVPGRVASFARAALQPLTGSCACGSPDAPGIAHRSHECVRIGPQRGAHV